MQNVKINFDPGDTVSLTVTEEAEVKHARILEGGKVEYYLKCKNHALSGHYEEKKDGLKLIKKKPVPKPEEKPKP